MPWLAGVLLAAATSALPAHAQAWPPPFEWMNDPPARPALPALSDTNSAADYLSAGEYWLRYDDPKRAYAAGFWAARIDPASARAFMLQWQAAWQAAPGLRRRLDRNPKKTLEDADVRTSMLRLDSLYRRALLRDPFELVDPSLRGNPAPTPPYVAELLRKHPNSIELRIHQAARHYRREQYDSAVTYLQMAREILERRERDAARPSYVSKVMFHFAAAKAHEAVGDRNAARAEYGAALAEELGFAPAHAGLASIAWQNWSDPATARREYTLALELDSDPVVRFEFARMLRRYEEFEAAALELERVVYREPYYAAPYLLLGEVCERMGHAARAASAYTKFVARAPRSARADVERAQARIAILEQLLAPEPP